MRTKILDRIIITILSMLSVVMIITQLWDPDYIGALFTGYLIGYTIVYWLLSNIIHGYRNLVTKIEVLVKKLIREKDALESQIFFLKKIIDSKSKPTKKTREKK